MSTRKQTIFLLLAMLLASVSVSGQVLPRTPIRMNLDAFSQSINKIDETAQEAIEQQSAIAAIIGQLELNEQEDKWKYNYIKDIQRQIDDAATFGDYSRAIDLVTKLSGKVASDPALRGRLKANAAYKNFVNGVLKQNIDADTRQWALEKNPYKYEDIKDDNGNIIGGTEWKPEVIPVDNYDLFKLGSSIIAQLKPEKSNGTEHLGKEKLKRAIKNAIEMTPDAKAYVEQKRNVLIWKYGKNPNEANDAVFGDGRIKTKDEFIDGLVDPWADLYQ